MALADRLRHTVAIQRATAGARDERGVPTQTWATLATVAAWVQPLRRREATELSDGGAVRATMIAFMLPTDIRESDRLVWNGATYHVDEVLDPAGKGHHLEVTLWRAET